MAVLQVAPDAPAWMHVGAGILLYSHIAGGSLAMVSGTVAAIAKKGGTLHRAAGNVFFASMLVMAGIGATVAPFLPDRMSLIGGFMTLYFIVTSWVTARSQGDRAGAFEIGAAFFAAAGLAATLYLAWLASQTPEGTLDNVPPQAFYVFGFVSTIALLSDIKVILRRGISGSARIARHVWRMCFAFFVATGSFFLGQIQMLPEWMQRSPLPFLLALAPLALLIFWVLVVRLSRKWRGPPRDMGAAMGAPA